MQRQSRLEQAKAGNVQIDAAIAALTELKAAKTASAYSGDDFHELTAEYAMLKAAYACAELQYDELSERMDEIAGELRQQHNYCPDEGDLSGSVNWGAAHPDNPSYLRECAA